MTPETKAPFDWIRKVSKAHIRLDEIPLLGDAADFSWEEFSQHMATAFELEGLKIELAEQKWRTGEELLAGFSSEFTPLNFTLTPLEGGLFWLMNAPDLNQMIGWLVSGKGKNPILDLPEDTREGFMRFATLEILHHLGKFSFVQDLSLQILAEQENPSEEGFCLDISISYQDSNLCGRLVISKELQTSWKQHFIHKQHVSTNWQRRAEILPITLHVEVGRSNLKKEDWANVAVGDFVVLDSCTVPPGEEKKPHVLFTIHGRPCLQGSIEEKQIRITEKPLLYEVKEAMDTELPEEEEEIVEQEPAEETPEEEEEAPEMKGEEEVEEEGETSKEEEAPPEEEKEEEVAVAVAVEKEEAEPEEKGPFSVEKLELPLVIELGRIHMSVKQLMDLQPGNLVDLDVHPENGVDLVVNGKLVGKGEILRFGETLGVRVIDLFS